MKYISLGGIHYAMCNRLKSKMIISYIITLFNSAASPYLSTDHIPCIETITSWINLTSALISHRKLSFDSCPTHDMGISIAHSRMEAAET